MFSSSRLPRLASQLPLKAGLPLSQGSRYIGTQAIKQSGDRPSKKQQKESGVIRDKDRFQGVDPLDDVFSRARQIKNKNLREGGYPNVRTYYRLMNVLGANQLAQEAVALLEDIQACGLTPDAYIYNSALKACHGHPTLFQKLLVQMEKENIPRNQYTFYGVVQNYAFDKQLELALREIVSMLKAGFDLNPKLAETVARAAVNANCPRLALDMLQLSEAGHPGSAAPSILVRVLSKCVEMHWVDGIKKCLDRLKESTANLNEGLITEILLAAARINDIKLAQTMLERLEQTGVKIRERHLGAFVTIHTKSKNVPGLFETFQEMTSRGIKMTDYTIRCVADGVSQSRSKAFLNEVYAKLESFKNTETGAPIAVINTVLAANTHSANDVPHWKHLYENLNAYKATPNIQTFECLLDLCVKSKDEGMSQRIYEDLMSRAAHAALNPSDVHVVPKPSAKIYDSLALIAVQQPKYEAAFHWLEESKAAGFTPSRHVYTAVIRRCASWKDPRWEPALQEMKSIKGYRTAEVERFLRDRKLLPPREGEVLPEQKPQSKPSEEVRSERADEAS